MPLLLGQRQPLMHDLSQYTYRTGDTGKQPALSWADDPNNLRVIGAHCLEGWT